MDRWWDEGGAQAGRGFQVAAVLLLADGHVPLCAKGGALPCMTSVRSSALACLPATLENPPHLSVLGNGGPGHVPPR